MKKIPFKSVLIAVLIAGAAIPESPQVGAVDNSTFVAPEGEFTYNYEFFSPDHVPDSEVFTLAPAPPPPEPEPPAPEPVPEPVVAAYVPPAYVPPPGTLSDRQLQALIFCESNVHGRYQANTENGFYGAVQWMLATWRAAAHRAGVPEWAEVRPDLVPPEVQDHVTRVWWASSNPRTQWPVCSQRVGPY